MLALTSSGICNLKPIRDDADIHSVFVPPSLTSISKKLMNDVDWAKTTRAFDIGDVADDAILLMVEHLILLI